MTDKMPELLPCPFCSGANVEVLSGLYEGDAQCKSCGAIAGLDKWNTRTPTATEQQERIDALEEQVIWMQGVLTQKIEAVTELTEEIENWKGAAHRQMERQPVHIIDPRQSEIITELTAALEGHIELYNCDGDYQESTGEAIQARALKALQKAKEMG